MRRLAVALGALAVLSAGCSDQALPEPDLSSRIEVDNAELRAFKADAKIADCPTDPGGSSDLPDLTLPCLGGGPAVNLSELSGPAVVQLWASWCTSCPDELPLFQRLAEEHGDEITVIGVDYQDTQPGAALTLARDTGATYPQLADPGGDLADHYKLTGLPGLLLVDAEGAVHFELNVVDDYAELRALVEQHTGVRVDG